MTFGFPCDLTPYKLLTDWGSFLAGILALAAGILAYWAGREAVNRQLAAQAAERAREVLNIRVAVRTEIIAFCKFVIGVLDICGGLARQEWQMPRSDTNAIVKSLQEPIVFPAVADRVALLPNPHLAVQFYLRLEEAKAMAQAMAMATATNLSVPPVIVTPENAATIADCLITALQCARPLVAYAPENTTPAEDFVITETLQQIDAAMAAARATFPGAESFQGAPAG